MAGAVNQFRDGFRQLMSHSKESITYQTITRARDTDDNPVETPVDSSVYAIVQILRLEDIQEIGGMWQVGDAMVFFDHNATVTKEDKIVHQSITYRIVDIIPERVKGSLIFIQAMCKREEY